MELTDYLKDELKRLNRINDKLEKDFNTINIIKNNEPELINNNVIAMCEIANTLNNLHANGLA